MKETAGKATYVLTVCNGAFIAAEAGLLDDMNNWHGPKYMLAEGDTYMKYPDDDVYPEEYANYVRLDKTPTHKEGWSKRRRRG